MMPSWTVAAIEVERLLSDKSVDALAAANAQQFIGAAMVRVADCDAVNVNPYMNSVLFDWSADALQIEIHSHAYEVYRLNASPVGIREFRHVPCDAISDSMMELLPKR